MQGRLRVASGPLQADPSRPLHRPLGGDRYRQLEPGLRAAVPAVGVDAGGVLRAVDQR